MGWTPLRLSLASALPNIQVDRLEGDRADLTWPGHEMVDLARQDHQRDAVWIGSTGTRAPVQAVPAARPLLVVF
jgi:hypothetical protein